MEPTRRYNLKLAIDEVLKPYGAITVSWVTGWSELVIRKYDHPYSADRSVIFEAFIRDEADWNIQRPLVEQELSRIATQESCK